MIKYIFYSYEFILSKHFCFLIISIFVVLSLTKNDNIKKINFPKWSLNKMFI